MIDSLDKKVQIKRDRGGIDCHSGGKSDMVPQDDSPMYHPLLVSVILNRSDGCTEVQSSPEEATYH